LSHSPQDNATAKDSRGSMGAPFPAATLRTRYRPANSPLSSANALSSVELFHDEKAWNGALAFPEHGLGDAPAASNRFWSAASGISQTHSRRPESSLTQPSKRMSRPSSVRGQVPSKCVPGSRRPPGLARQRTSPKRTRRRLCPRQSDRLIRILPDFKATRGKFLPDGHCR
jgi:hypothetical protein